MIDGVTTEYTPTTAQVRDGYAMNEFGEVSDRYAAEFDRWLAAHDREVAEKAWDEGYQRGLDTQYGTATPTGKSYDPDPNPYRLEQSND
ncbi:hypothetical protein GCM10022239_03630 [Leifsonia bigeumensis]|uniref:Uncharacterized protein n=1 Tax=Leifsonella bigeumensis TaxID=433643 RepID=A0ABP7F4X1_9MICO